MSERGSFVTEYIYCEKCFEAAKKILHGDDKFFKTVIVPMWTTQSESERKELPIIAGKIGGYSAGEEIYMFQVELLPRLARFLCEGHDVTVAVMSDSGKKVFLSCRENAEMQPSIAPDQNEKAS